MENSQLPDDLLIEIFSRLPAKSVGKFRCLSKTWCTHLSTSQFINLHLITTRMNNQSQLFLENYNNSCYTRIPRIEDAGATKVELPFSSSMYGVVDSCNGLVLISSLDTRQLILVNPITLQHVQVPNPIFCLPRNGIGFGYDSCSDDYKIVIYNWCGVDTRHLEVYSVKSKVWKRASSSPKHPIADRGHKGVFTNGAIHWIAFSSGTCIIVAFNLADEVFYYFPFPASLRFLCYCVYLFEGCLCVIDRNKNDIWLMKEYGVQDSWTRFTVNLSGIYRPLCSIGDDEIVLITSSRRVIVYDLVEKKTKYMIGYRDYTDGVVFSDSLVSLSSNQHDLSSKQRTPSDDHLRD